MAQITINTLLKAGVHFGHQTRRWCPKMKPYIFGERNGIYILDLKQTIIEADKAYSFLAETAAKGGGDPSLSAPRSRPRRPSSTRPSVRASPTWPTVGWAACSPTS